MANIRPFLKYAGSKYSIVNRIKELLPNGKRLVEPFVGSGSVFLNTNYDSYLLADSNAELINLYQVLKTYGKGFVEYASKYFISITNNKEVYEYYKLQFNEIDLSNTSEHGRIAKAALFIYLNRHCYNGLYRVNSNNKFNVSFGKYKKPYFPKDELLKFQQKLITSDVTLLCQDWQETLNQVVVGDVVYCDPPYAPVSNTANFTAYCQDLFTFEKQEKLFFTLKFLASKGVSSVISNSNNEQTRLLYEYADKISEFEVKRTISCRGENRSKAAELIACVGF